MLPGILLAVAAVGGQPDTTWTLAVGGDLMLNSISPKAQPFRTVAPFFKQADLAYANLEIPLTDATTRTPRKSAAAIARKTQFVLKADPAHGPALKAMGLDMVSLGNNHAMDFSVAGLRQMTDALDALGIAHAGAGEDESKAFAPVIVEVKGIKVAMLSAMTFQDDSSNWATTPATRTAPGVNAFSFQAKVTSAAKAKLAKWIQAAKKQAEVVLVMFHFGMEKHTLPIPYQVSLSRTVIGLGADAVIGAHPHVLQGAELYKGRPIFYSLGNFISPLGGQTAYFELTFSGKKFVKATMLPASYSAGRISPLLGASAKASVTRYHALSKAAANKFPNPDSKPISPELWTRKD